MNQVERSVFYIIGAALAALVVIPYLAALAFPQQVFFDWAFFTEVFISGLLAGVMYSLVALGFVLIFKASGVFNFAQGFMVLFAALALVWAIGKGLPVWLAILTAAAIMVVLAVLIERVVLRPLVNQEPIILFMATIGIAFLLDGLGQTFFGSNVYVLNLPYIADLQYQSFEFYGVRVNHFDVFAAITAGILVTVLALFFHKTRIGRALRAVADDHQAAMSVGIPLKSIWVIVWSVAGLVALVAGIIWGTKLSVQFSLSLIALKALPVLILGGFTSIPGAIIGGLLIGAGEKVAEVFLGPLVGGGIEDWFAYMLALVFLVFRPQGMFGEKIIERV